MQMDLTLEDSAGLWAAVFASTPAISAQSQEKMRDTVKRSSRLWHDLRLQKKYHEGLVAVVRLTHKATGEYHLHAALDVLTYFRQLDEQLHRGKHHVLGRRLQELFDVKPDFHVQLITFAQYRTGDSAEHRRYAWGPGYEGACELFNELLQQGRSDALCLNTQEPPYGLSLYQRREVPIPYDWLCDPRGTQAEEINHRQYQRT